jgi:predicted transport protein
MKIYSLQKQKLSEIKENAFKLERDIQNLFENNLEELMGLSLVKSEFTIKNKRIDTLAYDKQTNAFVIIEVKRDKNLSVVDQGFTYLSLMLENKADFIVEFNECLNGNLRKDDVDWTQSRVAFISTAFTDNQIQATNFKDIAIELWEVKQYKNDLIVVLPIRKNNSAASIKPVMQKNQTLRKISEEIKVYTEDDHLNGADENIVELYEKFKSSVFNLADDIEVDPQKYYIAFKKNKNLFDIEILKKSLKISVNTKFGNLNDPKQLARDVRKIGHRGNGDYQIHIDSDKDLEYIMSLLKQVLLK